MTAGKEVGTRFSANELVFWQVLVWLPFPITALGDLLLMVVGAYDPTIHDQIVGGSLVFYWCRVGWVLLIAIVADFQLLRTARLMPDMRRSPFYATVRRSWIAQLTGVAVLQSIGHMLA